MKHSLIATTLLLLFTLSCSDTGEPEQLPDNVQAITLTGDTLYTNIQELPAAVEQRIDSLIDEAEADHDLTTMLIWQARKKGYKGDYRGAVEVLSAALENTPEEARLYRHRGHRYISLRQFDKAIDDFEKAAELFEGQKDLTEPDGLPNAQNIPLSSLQTNTWYHLGLAHYLKGDYDKAAEAYEQGIRVTNNDDMLVAFLYWHYMSLRRDGDDVQAGKILEEAKTGMNITENDSYHQLLLVFKGVFTPEDILGDDNNALDNATLGYGLGNWHYINGREERARSMWQEVLQSEQKTAFGYIAAESEMAKRDKLQ